MILEAWKVNIHKLFTKGKSYSKIVLILKIDDVDSKPLEELPFIPLFVYGTLRLGGHYTI